MPTAPLYYRPYMEALLATTAIPLGDGKSTTLHELRPQQLVFDVVTNEKGLPVSATPVSPAAKEFDEKTPDVSNKLGSTLIGGIGMLQSELPGSAPIKRYQFATSDAGDISNRIDTALRNHPDLLESVEPAQVAALGEQLVKSATEEVASKGYLRFAGDTIDVGTAATRLLMGHAEGKDPLQPGAVAALAGEVGRELHRAVTPVATDTTSPLTWLDDATHTIAAHWPGAISRVAEAMQLPGKPEELELYAKDMRLKDGFQGPQATYMRSLTSLLNAGGIDTESPDASTAAFQVLQAKPLEDVPLGIAQALLQNAKLPGDAATDYATSLVETQGTENNVKGLLARIELQRRDAADVPQVPPPGDPTPEPVPVPAPGPAPEPDPVPVPGPAPAPGPEPSPDQPAPAPGPAPQPSPTPGPNPGPVPEPMPEQPTPMPTPAPGPTAPPDPALPQPVPTQPPIPE